MGNCSSFNGWREFFRICAFHEERRKDSSKGEVVGNDTMLGQIASFMENLHLSYKEVFEVIPYRNLIIMQKDKLHEVTGELVQESSGKDMASRRRQK
ncbi:MAG: hypothetical protein H6Q13_3249 [Bacteroidetes bacterium]|nr:hypothetical protein [Bacteroidota bacterium]